MSQLLYIHGFLSSPLSYKAQSMGQWLQQAAPDIHYHCPQLTPYPDECASDLCRQVELALERQQMVYLVGSSMGGFWATWLAETYDLPAVLINPAVDVMGLMPKYLNQTLHNYHTDDTYCLYEKHLLQLSRYQVPVSRHKNYWLLVQMGDETLDYRLAVKRYQGARQTVESGGDHGFQSFSRHHQAVIDFFRCFKGGSIK